MAGTVIVPALLMNKLPYLARPAGSKPDKIVEGEFNDFALRGRWWIATTTKRRRPVLGFILCRRYHTVDGWTVDRLHLEVSLG